MQGKFLTFEVEKASVYCGQLAAGSRIFHIRVLVFFARFTGCAPVDPTCVPVRANAYWQLARLDSASSSPSPYSSAAISGQLAHSRLLLGKILVTPEVFDTPITTPLL